jgi:hypothetical protein
LREIAEKAEASLEEQEIINPEATLLSHTPGATISYWATGGHTPGATITSSSKIN